MAPKEKDFVALENLQVMIPYKTLEQLVNSAQNYSDILTTVQRLDKRCAALGNMYLELLEKYSELYNLM